MPAIIWRKLVIDASVARACGGTEAIHPTPKHCRDFLNKVQAERYGVVMTPAITAEWKKHRSNFAFTWLTAMARRGKVFDIRIVSDERLSERIELEVQVSIPDEQERKAMLDRMRKDLLLIEAALASDKTVISLDEKVRKSFGTSAKNLPELQEVVWVNPARIAEEQPLQWLKAGAKPDRVRLLGFEPN